jgi:hypothetical protein
MELFKQLQLIESEKQAHRDLLFAVRTINDVYKEWKKRGKNRRKNAVSLLSTSVNKIVTIPPESFDYLNYEMKQKAAIIIMRCLSLPSWRDVGSKKSAYKKLYPYISKLEAMDPNTGTRGSLREIILTRFSAAYCAQSDYPNIFVAYEPVLPNDYLQFIFGNQKLPQKTYRMQAMPLPNDFDDLLSVVKKNHDKAIDLYQSKNSPAEPVDIANFNV